MEGLNGCYDFHSRWSVMLILCLLQANTVYGALRGLEVMHDYDLSLE